MNDSIQKATSLLLFGSMAARLARKPPRGTLRYDRTEYELIARLLSDSLRVCSIPVAVLVS